MIKHKFILCFVVNRSLPSLQKSLPTWISNARYFFFKMNTHFNSFLVLDLGWKPTAARNDRENWTTALLQKDYRKKEAVGWHLHTWGLRLSFPSGLRCLNSFPRNGHLQGATPILLHAVSWELALLQAETNKGLMGCKGGDKPLNRVLGAPWLSRTQVKGTTMSTLITLRSTFRNSAHILNGNIWNWKFLFFFIA